MSYLNIQEPVQGGTPIEKERAKRKHADCLIAFPEIMHRDSEGSERKLKEAYKVWDHGYRSSPCYIQLFQDPLRLFCLSVLIPLKPILSHFVGVSSKIEINT